MFREIEGVLLLVLTRLDKLADTSPIVYSGPALHSERKADSVWQELIRRRVICMPSGTTIQETRSGRMRK